MEEWNIRENEEIGKESVFGFISYRNFEGSRKQKSV